MKKLILVFVLLCSPWVMAQEPAKDPGPATPAPAPAISADKAVTAPVAADTAVATDAHVVPEVGEKISADDMKEILANADEVLAAYKNAKSASGSKAKFLAIFAGLAILFKLLLSLMKVAVKADFWKGSKAKWIIRCSTAGLGLAVFLCANLGAGVPWYDAITMGLSGPFAIVVHEFTSKPKAADKKA